MLINVSIQYPISMKDSLAIRNSNQESYSINSMVFLPKMHNVTPVLGCYQIFTFQANVDGEVGCLNESDSHFRPLVRSQRRGLTFFLSLFHTHMEKKETDKAIAEFNFQCKVKRKLIWQSQLSLQFESRKGNCKKTHRVLILACFIIKIG